MRLHWIGGPSFLLELGAFQIACDPVLGDTLPDTAGTRRVATLPPIDAVSCDAVVLSRSERIDDAGFNHFARSAALVAPRLPALASKADAATALELAWWQDVTWTRGEESITVTAVPTRRGRHAADAVESPESNGYVFRHRHGEQTKTAYWTGDTIWFHDARAIKDRFGAVELLILHLGAVAGPSGERLTLTGKDAMQFLFMFQPKRVVPIGHHTFTHYTESVDGFKRRVDLTIYDRRLIILKEGETYQR